MIQSPIPPELQTLTQIKEMSIAIMREHIRSDGQRGYSGHCNNLLQNVEELALIVLKFKGKENTFKDVTVCRAKVRKALSWLIDNKPQYKCVNMTSLNSLPENGVPSDLTTVETEYLNITIKTIRLI